MKRDYAMFVIKNHMTQCAQIISLILMLQFTVKHKELNMETAILITLALALVWGFWSGEMFNINNQ